MRLYRLESPQGNPEKGGILMVVDEDKHLGGVPLQLEWVSNTRVDIHKLTKLLTMSAIERLRKNGRWESAGQHINWRSVEAAVQRHVVDWDRTLGEALAARLDAAEAEAAAIALEKGKGAPPGSLNVQ